MNAPPINSCLTHNQTQGMSTTGRVMETSFQPHGPPNIAQHRAGRTEPEQINQAECLSGESLRSGGEPEHRGT